MPKTLQPNALYNFTADNAGNLRFNYGTTLLNGVHAQDDSFITGHLHLDAYQSELRATGDVIAFYSSDKRMKDNITVITNPISKLKNLQGVMFDWNENGPDWTKSNEWSNGKHDVGVIAQEVKEVLPEAVKERGNGYLSVDYKRLIPLLIEGFKEQQNQIEELKIQIKELKNGN